MFQEYKQVYSRYKERFISKCDTLIFFPWQSLKRQSTRFSRPQKRSKLQRYLFPIILVSSIVFASICFKFLVGESIWHALPFIIILSAWFGGLGPGFLATILVVALDVFFFLPAGERPFNVYNILSACILLVSGVFVSFISEARREMDRQKDEFIGFASHELKNPLASILIYAQLLQKLAERKGSEKVASFAAIIEEQTKNATKLIHELLDLTRIETGKLSFQYEIVSIFDLVRKIVIEQRMIYSQRKIIFRGRTRKKIRGDVLRLEQVIVNLLINALKYSPENRSVIVSIKNKKGSVLLSVQDFGKGIAKENVAKVFSEYFREKSVSQGPVLGLGLGLFICMEIIKKHKGKIWVESIEGKGSTFYMLLPTIS